MCEQMIWIKSLLILNLLSYLSTCRTNRLSSTSCHISSSMQSHICDNVNLSVICLISIKFVHWSLLKMFWSLSGSFLWSSIWISSVMILISSVPYFKFQTKHSFGMLLLGIVIYDDKDSNVIIIFLKISNQIGGVFMILVSNNSLTIVE